MWVGFHDDPSFRWAPTARGSSVVRRTARDRSCACSCSGTSSRRSRPTIASDPFDPRTRSTTWTRPCARRSRPTWRSCSPSRDAAVGERRRATDAEARLRPHRFARAISSRYSGRFDGYPFVRFWSVWNEPNLTRFLAPQFNARRQVARPGELREALRGRVHRDQGRQPASRSWRSARPPPAGATAGRRSVPTTRPAASPSSSRRRTRA